ERTGAIGDLTRWVLDTALAQTRAWRDAGLDLTMAVNLAAPNIVDEALPDLVRALLERWGVPGDRLECEISEHTVMADPHRAISVLERLRALGVRLSLDDFGTGHSSLAYLKRLPLDEEHRLAAREHHVRAGLPRRAALGLRPLERGAVGLRGIRGGEHERRCLVVVALRAQPLHGARERELRAAEPFDEVAAACGADRLQRRQLVVQRGEAAGNALGEHLFARDDAVALEQQLGLGAAALGRIRLT